MCLCVPRVDIKCLPQLPFTFFLKQDLFLTLVLAIG